MIVKIEPLGPQHDRAVFSCGVPAIDDYLVAFNLQFVAPSSRIYVAIDMKGAVAGYYSLRPAVWEIKRAGKVSHSSIELELAMIGVRTDLQGKGAVGPALILHAFGKVMEAVTIVGGIQRLWVGPLNDRCRGFYRDATFTQPEPNGGRMYISVNEIADALSSLNADDAIIGR